jgi:general secretion pathway protein M
MKQRWERLFLPVRHAYRGLELREQIALAALAGFLVMVAVWMGLWRPVEQARASNAAAYAQAREDLAWMRAHAGEVSQIHADSHAGDGALLSVVSDTAQTYHIVVNRAEPASDGSLRLSLVGVPFARLLPWLDVLEREHAVRASQLSVESQNGKPGYVTASLVLRRSGEP